MGLLASCPASKGPQLAARICQRLDIAHYTFDMVDEFEHEVVLPFIKEYVSGRTPNPCLVCNRAMKFGHLLRKASEVGAGYIATGHYARIAGGGSGKEGLSSGGSRYLLLRALDRTKDQSYVLYGLTQDVLGRTMFPLGRLTKGQVRQVARDAGLPSAIEPESQEICFVTGKTYREFLLERGIKFEPGPILDTSGKVLGSHRGLPLYTIGQRKGLGLGGTLSTLYVVDIDAPGNALVVGGRSEAYSGGCIVADLNLIASDALSELVRGTCMVRYRARETRATMKPAGDGSSAVVEFEAPQFAVTPGQALVFYQDEAVYGGGVIARRL